MVKIVVLEEYSHVILSEIDIVACGLYINFQEMSMPESLSL